MQNGKIDAPGNKAHLVGLMVQFVHEGKMRRVGNRDVRLQGDVLELAAAIAIEPHHALGVIHVIGHYHPVLDGDMQERQHVALREGGEEQREQQKQQQEASQDHQGNPQQQPGNDQPQDSKDSKDGKGDQQGQDGSEKKQSKDPGKDDKGGSDQDGKKKDSQPQDKSSGQNKPGDEKNAAQQPKEGSEAGKDSQQKFQQSLDQALAKDGKNGQKPPQPVRLGAREADQRSEQNQAVEHWLQRVPDDPGGLLRRKFLLEHQRREQHGDDNG